MMATQSKSPFAELVAAELIEARQKHGPMNSLHESWAVIYEEVDELWEHVRKKAKNRDKEEILKELVQIAAMCQKSAEDLILNNNSKT